MKYKIFEDGTRIPLKIFQGLEHGDYLELKPGIIQDWDGKIVYKTH